MSVGSLTTNGLHDLTCHTWSVSYRLLVPIIFTGRWDGVEHNMLNTMQIMDASCDLAMPWQCFMRPLPHDKVLHNSPRYSVGCNTLSTKSGALRCKAWSTPLYHFHPTATLDDRRVGPNPTESCDNSLPQFISKLPIYIDTCEDHSSLFENHPRSM